MAKNTSSPKNSDNEYPRQPRTDPTNAQKGYNEKNPGQPEGAFPPEKDATPQPKKPRTKN